MYRSAIRIDFLGIGPQKIGGPRTTYFRRLRNSMATLRANISGKEHDAGAAFARANKNISE